VPTEETKAFLLVEYYYTALLPSYTSRVIPEDLTDNELDEVLNAKTSFKKEL
jgi:hypothetical protein